MAVDEANSAGGGGRECGEHVKMGCFGAKWRGFCMYFLGWLGVCDVGGANSEQ